MLILFLLLLCFVVCCCEGYCYKIVVAVHALVVGWLLLVGFVSC